MRQGSIMYYILILIHGLIKLTYNKTIQEMGRGKGSVGKRKAIICNNLVRMIEMGDALVHQCVEVLPDAGQLIRLSKLDQHEKTWQNSKRIWQNNRPIIIFAASAPASDFFPKRLRHKLSIFISRGRLRLLFSFSSGSGSYQLLYRLRL